MAAVLAEIMAGNASETQTAAVLIALRTKGETVDELAGLAAHDARARRPGRRRPRRPDRHRRHGRRAADVQRLDHGRARSRRARAAPWPSTATARATGLSGSADVLEALGARIDLDAGRRSRAASSEVGFGFMFAPAHHSATRYVVPVRKELAVRTIFNFLGPLTNPAGATRQVIGVSDPPFLETIAGALARLGARPRARGVRAPTALDELSICGGDARGAGRRRRGGAQLRLSTPEDVGPAAGGVRGRRGAGRPRPTPRPPASILGGVQGPCA